MSEPISVIVPTVAAPCFRECIERLLVNTAAPFDLIIVCDEPGPVQRAIFQEIGWRPNVKIILGQTQTLSSNAFNRGIKAARGQLLALVSDDVLVGPRWLQPLVQTLTDHPEWGSVSPIVEREAKDQEWYFSSIGEGNLITRALIDKVGLLDQDCPVLQIQCADADYYVRMLRAGFRPTGVVESRVRHLVGQTVRFFNIMENHLPPLQELVRRYGEDGEWRDNQHHLRAYSAAEKKLLWEHPRFQEVPLPHA